VKVEKYVIFINLANFSMRNQPPWAATKETLATLQEQLPERFTALAFLGWLSHFLRDLF